MLSPQRFPAYRRVVTSNSTVRQTIRPKTNQNQLRQSSVFNQSKIKLDNEFFDPYRAITNDQFGEGELIRALRTGQKQKFLQLYSKHCTQQKVNQFMYNVFVYGKNFHPSLKIPDQLNYTDSSGKTLLHYAAAGDLNLQEGYFTQLVQKFAGQQDSRGITALMMAAVYGNTRAITALMKYEIQMQDTNGTTALMCASRYRQNAAVDILLAHECTMTDKNGFVFIDYFPKTTEETFIQHINCLVKKYFKDFQELRQGKGYQQKVEIPDYIGFVQLTWESLEQVEIKIEQSLTTAKQQIFDCIAEQKEKLFQEIKEYQNTKYIQQYNLQFNDYYNMTRNDICQREDMFADETDLKISELNHFIDKQVSELEQIKSASIDLHFKPNMEQLHLLMIYETNELYENFDKMFLQLKQVIEKQKKEAIDKLVEFNKLTNLQVEYITQRGDAQDKCDEYLHYNQQLYEKLYKKFEYLLKDIHESLDSQYNCLLFNEIRQYKQSLQIQKQDILDLLEEKQIKKIDDGALMILKSITDHPTRINTSQFPDVQFFKDQMDSLIQTFQLYNKTKMSHDFFKQIFSFSQQFIEEDDGMLNFMMQTSDLPLKNTFTQYKQIDEYFNAFKDSKYKFSSGQLKNALVIYMINKYSNNLEKQLIAFLHKYFTQKCNKYQETALQNSQSQRQMGRKKNITLGSIYSKRVGNMQRQRLFFNDQTSDMVDIAFTFFYLSIIGIFNNIEFIDYSNQQFENVLGEELNNNLDYKLTMKTQTFDDNKLYDCLCPGWMKMQQNQQYYTLIDPVWEVNE